MGKGHARNEDVYLNKGGVNEVSASDTKDAVTKKHEHSNKTLLDTYNQTNSDILDAITKKHTQNSDTDLDSTFEATFVKKADNINVLADISSDGADIEDAVTKRHNHSNKSTLDLIEEALTTSLKTAYDDAVSKKHEHSNKALLDTYDQTNADIADAISKEHIHSNKSELDLVTDGDHDVRVDNPHAVNVDQLDWSSAIGKTEIEDAVDKKHTQNTDTGLDIGGSNPITALQIKNKFDKNKDNIVINAFRIAINGALAVFNMIDSIIDEYEDETGIDTGASTNEVYNSEYDYYINGVDLEGDIISRYKMNDNASNPTVDDDVGSNDGTFNDATGDPNTDAHTIAGKINTALDLDGVDDYIDISSILDDIASLTVGSIAFWAKVDGDYNAQNNVFTISNIATETKTELVVDFDTRTENDRFVISCEIDGVVQWSYRTPDNSLDAHIGNWVFVVVTHDGTAPKLYINGILQTTGTWTSELDKTAWWKALLTDATTPANTGQIGILRRQATNWSPFNGKVDVFMFFDKELIQTEIDALYNSGNGRESVGGGDAMVLQSSNFTAESTPDDSRIVMLEEDIDAVTLNTDLKAYASRDNGATWSQITLADEGDFDSSKRILVGEADISGQPSGTNMKYKLTTHNSKGLKIHGTSLLWS